MRHLAISLCIIVTTFCVSLSPSIVQKPLTYAEHMALAGEASQSKEWAALNEQLDAAQKILLYSLLVWRNRVLARMLAGREGAELHPMQVMSIDLKAR